MLRWLLSSVSLVLIGLTILIGFAVLKLSDFHEITEFREQTFDTYARLKPREYRPEDKVRIIDIDERSLEKYGQWPWPRTLLADLFSALGGYKVRLVGFDGFFPEYDRSSPIEIINNYESVLSPATREELEQVPRTEYTMAKAMGNVPVVMGLIGIKGELGDEKYYNSDNSSIRTWFEPFPKKQLTYFAGLKGSVAEIENVATGLGVFSLQLIEQEYRHAPLLVNVGDKSVFPSLTLEMLRIGLGGVSISLNNPKATIRGVTIHQNDNKITIPTNSSGHARIYFSEPQNYNQPPNAETRYISAMDVLDGSVPRDALADTYVLIGSSASGLKDLRSTPLSPALPGVELHANLLEALISNEQLREPEEIPLYEMLVLLLGGLMLIVLSTTRLSVVSLFVVTGLIGLNVGVSWYLFDSLRILYDPVYSSICFFLLFTSTLMLTYLREIREKSFIRRAFQQYLSPVLVKQLTKSQKQLVLGGETRELTILFCDIRGFTAISESLQSQPQLLTFVINAFLTPLSNIITAQKGTIDKYIGDCIMAFWNAPLDIIDHADSAVLSAIKMSQALDSVNDKINRSLGFERRINIVAGIGINTGSVVVGNMGSETRFDYSVLGDPVNLASRLESQSRHYHLNIIIGGETYRRLSANKFQCIEVDLVSVKGKKEPTRMFTILGEMGKIPLQSWNTFTELHSHFLTLYRSLRWHEAKHHLRQAQRIGPAELFDYYEVMLKRINIFLEDPPPPHWDGVYFTSSK